MLLNSSQATENTWRNNLPCALYSFSLALSGRIFNSSHSGLYFCKHFHFTGEECLELTSNPPTLPMKAVSKASQRQSRVVLWATCMRWKYGTNNHIRYEAVPYFKGQVATLVVTVNFGKSVVVEFAVLQQGQFSVLFLSVAWNVQWLQRQLTFWWWSVGWLEGNSGSWRRISWAVEGHD